MTKEERKVNKLLIKVKYNAFKLKEEGQLPSFLYLRISKLGFDSSMELVRCYMAFCESALRVKGYYKKFPECEGDIEKSFNEFMKERGYN